MSDSDRDVQVARWRHNITEYETGPLNGSRQYVVAFDLRRRIQSQALNPGEALPELPIMAEAYGVSTLFLEGVVRGLADEGLLEISRPRLGTIAVQVSQAARRRPFAGLDPLARELATQIRRGDLPAGMGISVPTVQANHSITRTHADAVLRQLEHVGRLTRAPRAKLWRVGGSKPGPAAAAPSPRRYGVSDDEPDLEALLVRSAAERPSWTSRLSKASLVAHEIAALITAGDLPPGAKVTLRALVESPTLGISVRTADQARTALISAELLEVDRMSAGSRVAPTERWRPRRVMVDTDVVREWTSPSALKRRYPTPDGLEVELLAFVMRSEIESGVLKGGDRARNLATLQAVFGGQHKVGQAALDRLTEEGLLTKVKGELRVSATVVPSEAPHGLSPLAKQLLADPDEPSIPAIQARYGVSERAVKTAHRQIAHVTGKEPPGPGPRKGSRRAT